MSECYAGGAIGDCTTDYFSIATPGNRGSPSICGFNTGQHGKFYDSSDNNRAELKEPES